MCICVFPVFPDWSFPSPALSHSPASHVCLLIGHFLHLPSATPLPPMCVSPDWSFLSPALSHSPTSYSVCLLIGPFLHLLSATPLPPICVSPDWSFPSPALSHSPASHMCLLIGPSLHLWVLEPAYLRHHLSTHIVGQSNSCKQNILVDNLVPWKGVILMVYIMNVPFFTPNK